MENLNISEIEQYIIDKIRDMRIEKGLSQRELATLIDKSHGFIAKVENPKHRAKYNITLLNEIAKVFKCSPKDFWPDKPF